MKRGNMTGACCLLIAAGMLAGCGSQDARRSRAVPAPVAEVEQGMLGDLNHYVQQLLKQRAAGNAEAERVLIRLLAGKGLPASETAPAGRARS
ncbi:hypothetical protein ZP13_24795 [Salmonella enterica subsp. enterica]|nr:hypothetical protein [Salmonella enterica]ECC3607909.1 hypothetical protein [Salmonella enterica subsp. enterica]ECY4645547.1 hypothetical protein [Salmonella enterica subsp. enterica serovar Eastbourne]EBO9664758.1 hypothetical protein [Salmonella enterica]ECE0941375.1 hypothetical protein [Salmonella enterica subsp. enterica]